MQNAVWLCQNDAKRIDDDPARFTAELLRGWRRLAEDRARAEQGRPLERDAPTSRELVPLTRQLQGDRETLRVQIDAFLVDVGASQAWTPIQQLVYMTLYELTINALEHGRARAINLASDDRSITLVDDGKKYGIGKLRAKGRGGHLALTHLERTAQGTLSIRYQRAGRRNTWRLVDEIQERGANTPCALTIGDYGWPMMHVQAQADLMTMSDCEEIHMYAPPLWSLSDWSELHERIKRVLGARMLVIHGISKDSHAAQALEHLFSYVRIAD